MTSAETPGPSQVHLLRYARIPLFFGLFATLILLTSVTSFFDRQQLMFR